MASRPKSGTSPKKGAVPATPSIPELFIVPKDAEERLLGRWVIADGQPRKVGRPTSAGHRFSGQCTVDGARQGPGVEVYPNGNKVR